MLAKASIQTGDKLWYQMRMFRGLRYGRQARAGGLSFPRPGRNIAVGKMIVAIGLSLQIALHLILQQCQVQLAQRIWGQASAVESSVIANSGYALQLLRNAVEADGVDAVSAQGLKEKQTL